MANVAIKRAAERGPTIREQLRTMDDGQVVTSFLDGEERAFQELVERYQTRLLNFIYRTIGDREKAEDLVQEVFIRVYRHLHRFDRSKKFSTWAYRVSLNTAITLYRKSTRSVQTVNYDSKEYFISQEDYNYEEEEKLKLMYKAVYQLNDIEKALIFLYLEDKDYTEISETLGISEVNARVKMNRVKGKLKKILNP